MKKLAIILAALLLFLAGCGRGFTFSGGFPAITETEYYQEAERCERLTAEALSLNAGQVCLSDAERVASLYAVVASCRVKTGNWRFALEYLAGILHALEESSEVIKQLNARFKALEEEFSNGDNVLLRLQNLLADLALVREADRDLVLPMSAAAESMIKQWESAEANRVKLAALVEKLAAFSWSEAHAGLYGAVSELVEEMKEFPDAEELLPYRERLETLLGEVTAIRSETEAISAALRLLHSESPLAVCFLEEVNGLILRITALNSVDRALFAGECDFLNRCLEEIAERSGQMKLIRFYANYVASVSWDILDKENLTRVQKLLELLGGFPLPDRELLSEQEDILLRLRHYLEHKFSFS